MNSSLAPNDFSNFYSTIMTDTNDRTDEQLQDKLQVEEYYNQCKQGSYNHYITADQISVYWTVYVAVNHLISMALQLNI